MKSRFAVQIDVSPKQFLKTASELLYRHEAANSLLLGVCEAYTKIEPEIKPTFFSVAEDGQIKTAAMLTHVQLIISYATKPELDALIDLLYEKQLHVPGVVGPSIQSEYFATQWSKKSGQSAVLAMGQKIYQLNQVQFPAAIDGKFRVANPHEIDLIGDWIISFVKESLPSEKRSENEWRVHAEKLVKNETAHVWTVGGEAVALANVSRPTRNGISINAVYTPKENRKKGYASAVVAHTSQKMLDAGKKFCVLYTDLSNPTSNKIYKEVGYKEIEDSKQFSFS